MAVSGGGGSIRARVVGVKGRMLVLGRRLNNKKSVGEVGI